MPHAFRMAVLESAGWQCQIRYVGCATVAHVVRERLMPRPGPGEAISFVAVCRSCHKRQITLFRARQALDEALSGRER